MTFGELRDAVCWLREGGAELVVDHLSPGDPWELTPQRVLFLFLLAAQETNEATTYEVASVLWRDEVEASEAWAEAIVRGVRGLAIRPDPEY